MDSPDWRSLRFELGGTSPHSAVLAGVPGIHIASLAGIVDAFSRCFASRERHAQSRSAAASTASAIDAESASAVAVDIVLALAEIVPWLLMMRRWHCADRSVEASSESRCWMRVTDEAVVGENDC